MSRGAVTAQVIRDADVRLAERITKECDEVDTMCSHLVRELPAGTQSYFFAATTELPARELCSHCARLALFLEDFEAAMNCQAS